MTPSHDAEQLAAGLARLLSADVPTESLVRLTGGASRETWRFEADGRPLVLRRDPPGGERSGMEREAALLERARTAGVPVPAVLTASDDPEVLGTPFAVVEFLAGETLARRILRDAAYATARGRLVEQCARALAHLHAVHPESVPGLAAEDPIDAQRELIDALDRPRPVFELALRRLAATRPAHHAPGVVHGDFRLGNLMVDTGGLVAVLDWELAHSGDPREDLGWLCVRAWRFGSHLPVAGLGSREELLTAYAAAGGVACDLDTLLWWETYGTLRWGVMCIRQADYHLSGAVRSVELAAIGRRVAEQELDLLDLLDPAATPVAVGAEPTVAPGLPHPAPSAVELVEAVREFLLDRVLVAPELDAAVRFHTRVAANVLATVGRELTLAPAHAAAHAARLQALGATDERELCAQIRRGEWDHREDELVGALRAATADSLAVSNPGYLTR